MRHGHINTFNFDGILGEQLNATVIDDKSNTSVYNTSVVIPVLRAKLWGLFHGYGWLKVTK